MKVCRDCKISKNISEFSFENRYSKVFGHYVYFLPRCKKCHNIFVFEKNTKSRKRNLEKRNAAQKLYYRKNIKKCRKRNNDYYQANKEKILNYHKKHIRKRRLEDINVKLHDNISSFLRRALKKNKKSMRTVDLLGYTIQKLKQHLESQFEPWMNWNNWGVYRPDRWDDNNSFTWTWQIDHIIPRCKLKYKTYKDENFKKCWALENLRPLSSKINIVEGKQR